MPKLDELGVEIPEPFWVPDDWDRMRGHWCYPSQKQLDDYRKKRARAQTEQEASEHPL